MRRLTSGVTKFGSLLMAFAVILVACLAGVTFLGNIFSSGAPSFAEGADATNESKTQLKFGKNLLKAADINSENYDYSDGTIALSADDTVEFRPSIADKSTAYYAFSDSDTSVTITAGATFSTSGATSDFNVKLYVLFVPAGSVDENLEEEQTTSVAATSGAYNAELNVSETISGAFGMSEAYIVFRITSTVNISVSSLYVTLSSETCEQTIDSNVGVNMTISGANRTTVEVKNVFEDGALDNVYVKTGDVITFITSAQATKLDDKGQTVTSTMEYGEYYSASVGASGSSCIDWNSTMINVGGNLVNRSCLTRAEGQTDITYSTISQKVASDKGMIYCGYSAQFVVTSASANARSLLIYPRLVRGYNDLGSLEYWNSDSDSFELKVDNQKPNSPVLDETQTLGLAIIQSEWYTASNNFTLDYENGSDTFSGADEFVYAFIVDTKFMGLSASGYDFTPGSESVTYTYKTSSGSVSAKRQELGGFTKNISASKKKIEFEDGSFGLILYAVDAAGNVSSPKVYSPNTSGQTVKVDASVRNVGALFLYNGSEISPSKSNVDKYNKYAYTSVCVGPDYHDENGVFTSKTADEATDNTNAGQSANTGYIAVKRGTWVTVRIIMTAANYNDYALVRYYDLIGATKSNPTYKTGRDARIYDITFRMTDAVWANSAFPINVVFNRRVDLALNETDYVYTNKWSMAEAINLSFTAYFAKGDESVTVQPTIGVTYYKTYTYNIYANYTETEGVATLTSGGMIEINGKKYYFDDDEDIRQYITGKTSYKTSDLTGDHEYLAYKTGTSKGAYTDPETGKKYQLYEMSGYDVISAQTGGVTDAGTHFYIAKVEASSNLPYYAERQGTFYVEKADPAVYDIQPSGALTYGDSMDKLSFTSKSQDGGIIADSIAIQGKTYQKVSSGVYGEFVIESPLSGTAEYKLPNVSSAYKIVVRFNPIDVTSFSDEVIQAYYTSFFSTFYDAITDTYGNILGYSLKSGGQNANNYQSLKYDVTIVVNHKSVTVSPFDVNTSYDGTPKETSYIVLNTLSYGEDVPMIIEYKPITEGDSSYTTVKPEIAGVYDVRLIVDSSKANYVSTYAYSRLTVSKRELTLEIEDCDEYEKGSGSLMVNGDYCEYSGTMTYSYGTESTARYSASYVVEDKNVGIEVAYSYSFLKLKAYNGGETPVSISGQTFGESVSFVTSTYLDAGEYLMRVNVENDNNAGTAYVYVVVSQVTLNDSTGLTIATPSANASYYAVYLSGISYGRIGHLEYGQTLEEARGRVLGNGGSAKYAPRGSARESVSGRFYFESEDVYYARVGEEAEKNSAGVSILPVRYDEKGQILPYELYMLWQAGSYDDNGDFVPNYNFRGERFSVNIYVVRARADFSALKLTEIKYGQKVSESTFEGEIVSYGNVLDSANYTISIADDYKNLVPNCGEETLVMCNFTPTAELVRKYLPVTDVQVPITVAKRKMEITFATETIKGAEFNAQESESYEGVRYVYGDAYVNPDIAKTAVDDQGNDLKHDLYAEIVQFTYYTLAPDGYEGETKEFGGLKYILLDGGMNQDTPVGRYLVYAEVANKNGNYEGSNYCSYFVTKATLYYALNGGVLPQKSIQYGTNISDVDFGVINVINTNKGSYSKIFTGRLRVAVKEGDAYSYNKILDVTENTDKNVYVLFELADSKYAENYEANFYPYISEYYLEVTKRDISETIEFNHEDAVTFNGSGVNVSDWIRIPDPTDSAKALTKVVNYVVPEGSTGEVDKAGLPFKAGTYNVEVEVDSEIAQYNGGKTFIFTIAKAPLTINEEEVSFAYNTASVNYTAPSDGKWSVDISAYMGSTFTYDVTYYSDAQCSQQLSAAPSEIGSYYAHLELKDVNFEAEKVVRVNITPIIKGYSGLRQTYAPPTADEQDRIQAVTPIFGDVVRPEGSQVVHPFVNYTVKYKAKTADETEYTDTLPANAGEYVACVTFDQNGYDKAFEIDMVIDKAKSLFEPATKYEYTYNAQAITFKITLPEGVTVAEYTYFKLDGDVDDIDTLTFDYDQFTADAPVDAGKYVAHIVLVDDNYYGEADALIVITKAKLTAERAPVAESSVHFGDTSDMVTFVDGTGSVKVEGSGISVDGKWSVVTDISTKSAGTQNVDIVFTPDDENNYETVTIEKFELVIGKRDISEFIVFEEEFVEKDGILVYERTYTTKAISVHAKISDEAQIDAKYLRAVSVTVYYNNVSAAPSAVNASGYVLKVVVDSNNYEGTYDKGDRKLVIIKATPSVIPPTITSIDKGSSISYDNYAGYIGIDGQAYIENDGDRIIVQGSFYIVDKYIGVPFDKANEQPIEIGFIPKDTDSFNGLQVETTINVIGQDLEITDDDIVVTGSEVYGAPLSSFTIELNTNSEKAELGTIAWARPDEILHVGELAEYVFTPNDVDTYNVYRGYTSVNIGKAKLGYDEEHSTATLYLGDAPENAILSLALTNSDHSEIAVSDYTAKIVGGPSGVDITVAETDTNKLGTYIGNGGSFEFEITSSDYYIEGSDKIKLDIKIYLVKLITEFNVAVRSKYYDGTAVTIEDLQISAVGTQYTLDADDYEMSILLNGKTVSEIKETGVYTVTISINEHTADGRRPHSGAYTFEYVVRKTDISEDIGLEDLEYRESDGTQEAYVSYEYGQDGAGAVATFGDYDVDLDSVVYEYYNYNSKDKTRGGFLGSVPPTNAGTYVVLVKIASSDPTYEGSKEFIYEVEKLTISVTLDRIDVTYGDKYSVSPIINAVVSSGDITVTYHSWSDVDKNESEQPPTDAGSYRVIVRVETTNLVGYGTTDLTISQAALEEEETPTVSSIKYGTPLKTAKVTGGKFVTANGTVIGGSYEFADPDKKDLRVGEHTVTLVFKPTNANYQNTNCQVVVKIEKAEMEINFGSLEKYYTGALLNPDVITEVNVNFSYRTEDGKNTEARNAGVYVVTATIDDVNYSGTATAKFTIKKAIAVSYKAPIPSPVTYGNVLSTGYLQGGNVYYTEGGAALTGTFSYFNSDRVLGSVGTYKDVDVVFTPYDTDNYELLYIKVDVTVSPALATITVAPCEFTYGQTITSPNFTTSPTGLSLDNADYDNDMKSKTPDAGTYSFKVQIAAGSDYYGELTYQVVIYKKTVNVAYYNSTGDSVVTRYDAHYGSSIPAKAHIVETDFVGSDSAFAAEIEKGISYRYYSVKDGVDKTQMTPPTAVDEDGYMVYVVLQNTNYTVDREKSTVPYNIQKATVRKVSIDADSLSSQVYGSVVEPTVLTDPIGVGYKLEFPGYGSIMPTNAGTYNIKVIIDDANYQGADTNSTFTINPKEISVENLVASDKAADGLSAIEVTGDLKGVMIGDEVYIKFTATTEGNQSGVGTYPVVITSWVLSGLHAKNYKLRDPIYKLSATITTKVVYAKGATAYISSNEGFGDNVTVEAGEVYDTVNQTNFFTALVGQKATVQSITVKDCGLNTVLSNKIKFYVQIPEKYRNSATLEVKGRGGFEGVTFEREGDYVSFYADSSGEVLFYVNDFPYWVIVVAAAVLILVIGAILLVCVSPIKRRKRIPQNVRKTYDMRRKYKGVDIQYERKVIAKREEQKRRWKY